MNKNTLYYANTGKGSTITRELIANVFGALANNLLSESFCKFVSRSRVPNERELYGIFVKSILESCKNDIGHIATEFQVERNEESNDQKSKGRVDLLFDYRSVSYLVELKVGRVNARGNDRDPKIRAKKIWHTAIQQLNELEINSVDGLLNKKIVKLPIAIYFFDSTLAMEDEEIKHAEIHENILNFIRSEGEVSVVDSAPHFWLYSEMPRLATRLRKTSLSEYEKKPAEHDNYIYGFSMFAKQL